MGELVCSKRQVVFSCFFSCGWGSCAAGSVSFMMATSVTSPLCPFTALCCTVLLLWSFLYQRGCSPGSSVSSNIETWATTLNEVVREQGPPAGWNSSLTFSRHHPLLTPQLTSTSAPLLEEQRGRTPPLPFYLYFLLSFSAWIHPGPRKLPSYFTNALGKISLSRKSVITQELYFFFLSFTLFRVHRGGGGLEILKTPGRVCSDLFTKSSTFPLL